MAGTLGTFGSNNSPLVLNLSSGIVLTAGTSYWVTVADISGGSDVNYWNWNSTGDGSPQAISTDGGSTWFSPSGLPPGAYEVDGTTASVPEPSTLVLLASGVAGLLASKRRRPRNARRRSNRPDVDPLEGRTMLSTTFTWTSANAPSNGVGTMLQYPNGNIMMVGGGLQQRKF